MDLRTLFLPAALLLAADLAAAQAAASGSAPAPRGLARGAFGAAVVDGEVVAGGPDWKARFPAGRVVFTPALGARAERNLPLAFAFEAVERGSRTLAAAGGARASLAGERVSFAHAGGVVERYDATAHGLAQSFLIPERPAGSGDLVVRGRIDTELPFAGRLPGGGLAFELSGVGGVSIGAVTAVGADGAVAPGELRLDGTRLLLVVPGAFVDAAAYPLVVDPEIGPMLSIDGSELDDVEPDVAASSHATTRYLVVWARRFTLSDVDIRGLRLDEDGQPVGSLLLLENEDERFSYNPATAFVRASERFFVVWEEKALGALEPYQVVGRAVSGSGGVSSKLFVAPSTSSQTNPDVGGERTLADDDVLVVWGEAGLGVRARQVSLPSGTGSPFAVGGTVQVSDPGTGDSNARPAISSSAGDAGRFGLAYETGAGGPSATVTYRTISRDGTGLSPAQLLQASLPGPHSRPAIDGDGKSFLLLFERAEPLPSTAKDVWGATLTYTGADLSHQAFQPIAAGSGAQQTTPDAAFTGGQFLAGYIDDVSFPVAFAETIDPFSCQDCGDGASLSFAFPYGQDVKVAACYAAGLASNRALFVWESQGTGQADIDGQLFESPKGQVDLSGGCGQGGVASTPCPFADNANFAFHVDGGEPFAPAFLVLSFQMQAAACGACTLWPSLATADVFFAGLADQHGRASLPVALPPGTSGVTFISQWGLIAPGGACPFFGVDVSNGVRTTVQL